MSTYAGPGYGKIRLAKRTLFVRMNRQLGLGKVEMHSPQESIIKAALWMSGWLAAMITMAVSGRETVSQLSAFQVMELRAIIGFFLLLPLVIASGGLSEMKTSHPWRHVWRNAVHYFAQYAWLVAVTLIPLAQVISIEFTMPVWTALLAVLFLGENLNRWKVAAIILGLVGVVVIVRPTVDSIEQGQLLSLGAAFGFSISVILVKALTRTESVVRIIFWMLVIQGIIGAVPAMLVWQPVPFDLWPWIVLVAICGTFSHYCMARAMTHADTTIVVPMDFLRVPLVAVTGWLVYAEAIDLFTATGAVLILLGNLLNLKRSTRA
jgi:drug/metabolite transporter (DMT)-like permease